MANLMTRQCRFADTVAAMENRSRPRLYRHRKVMKTEPRLASGFSQFCSLCEERVQGDWPFL